MAFGIQYLIPMKSYFITHHQRWDILVLIAFLVTVTKYLTLADSLES